MSKKSRLGRLVLAGLLTATVITGVEAVTAQQAEAAGPQWAWVYISFPKWLGNCSTNGGEVKDISGEVSPGPTSWNHDFGDDIVYGKVLLHQENTVNYEALCYKGKSSAFQPGIPATFVPTRNGQTIWVGPTGTKMN